MPREASSIADRTRDDALVAAELFELTPTRIEIQLSESTTVARIGTADGDVAIKIFDADDVDTELTQWRHTLAAHAATRGLPVPAPLRSPAGALTETVRLGERTVLVQASAWSTGVALSDVPMDGSLLREVGRTASRLSLALADAPPPPAHEPHLWDLRRSGATLIESLGRVDDPETRIMGLRALRAFHAIERQLAELPSGIVHQDLHDDNLRVGHDGEAQRIVAILDFGDATHGPRIADLVIPAAYASRHCDDPLSAIETVIAGWTDLLPLDAVERSVVLPLAAARLATNAAVWHTRSAGERSEYAAVRSRGSLVAARTLLDTLE